MTSREVDPEFLKSYLEKIAAGMTEAIRREVKRLRELGLPIYVDREGEVVNLGDEPGPTS